MHEKINADIHFKGRVLDLKNIFYKYLVQKQFLILSVI